MPEVQNFNYLGTLLNAIDENRCMDELTDTLFSGHGASDIGKSFEQSQMVQECIAKVFKHWPQSLSRNTRESPRNRLVPGLRFESGNPLWNHLPSLIKGDRPTVPGGFDAPVNRGQCGSINLDLFGCGHLELEVLHNYHYSNPDLCRLQTLYQRAMAANSRAETDPKSSCPIWPRAVGVHSRSCRT